MTDSKTYSINEIFYSIQGEGARTGVPQVFIRFANCNLDCKLATHGFDCDTEFSPKKVMTTKEIAEEADNLFPETSPGTEKWVCLTGGEPALQVDRELCIELIKSGFSIAIETNGMFPIPHAFINWVTCSPKTPEETINVKVCEELKYVRKVGQEIPTPSLETSYKFISPAYDGEIPIQENIDWCVHLVLKNPDWRLSIQTHKVIGVR